MMISDHGRVGACSSRSGPCIHLMHVLHTIVGVLLLPIVNDVNLVFHYNFSAVSLLASSALILRLIQLVVISCTLTSRVHNMLFS